MTGSDSRTQTRRKRIITSSFQLTKTYNPKIETRVKQDTGAGRFMDQKATKYRSRESGRKTRRKAGGV